ncbi:hypothetical protein [Mycobacterium sp.]|uniref:hypothetical protein n=1 Tax=Mycobacterium sp. TaxID=1785 RepID=UPI003F9C9BBE
MYTLSSGWINDMYTGAGPTDPIYAVYGPTGGYESPAACRSSWARPPGSYCR